MTTPAAPSSGPGSLLVVGGASTIGKEIVVLFASKGIPVAFTSRKDATKLAKQLQERAQKLTSSSNDTKVVIEALVGDPVKVEDMKRVVQEAAQLGSGRLLYAINVAGMIQPGTVKPLWEYDMSDITNIINVNLTGVIIACREQVLQMKSQAVEKEGETPFAIINVASIYAHRGMALNAMYTSTKHAVLGLTRSLGLEAYRHGIRVNTISPGYHITDELRETPKEILEPKCDPVGQGGDFETLAKTFYHVAVEATYTAGTDFAIDGGFLARGPGQELDDFFLKY